MHRNLQVKNICFCKNLKKLYLTKTIIELNILDRQENILKAIQNTCSTNIDHIVNEEHPKKQETISRSIEPAFDISRFNN